MVGRLRGLTGSRVVNGVIILALALVGLMTFRAVHSDASTASAARQTASVDTGTVTATVSASGNVAAATDSDVSFSGEAGTVTAIEVEVGQKVRKGQLLATLDQSVARESLASAQAQLDAAHASYQETLDGGTTADQSASSVASAQQQVASAQLSVRQAQASYALTRRQQDAAVARAQHALDVASSDGKGAARQALVQAREQRATALLQGQQQVESAQQQVRSAEASLASARQTAADSGVTDSQVASAKAQVTQAEVTVEQARTTLAETVLRAPVSGTVTAINGSVGESSTGSSSASASTDATSSSSSSTTGSGFLTITSTRVLEVTADVAEADIADVEVGQKATVTLSATDRELAGTVSHVDTGSTVTNNVVEYGVTVRLDQGKGVRLGATAQVVVTTGSKQDVTRVASSALTTVGRQTTATVLESDGSTQVVPVTIGLVGDAQTEVLSGLRPGQKVVIPQATGTGSTGFTFPAGGPGGGLGGLGGPG